MFFEQLQVMKFAWHKNIIDLAAQNLEKTDEVDLGEYSEMLEAELQAEEFDIDADEFILEDQHYIIDLLSQKTGLNHCKTSLNQL